MDSFRLPPGTSIGHVHLQVAELNRSLGFYEELLGFRRALTGGDMRGEADTVALSATGEAPFHIVLTERAWARPRPQGTTGLYHLAVRFPNRQALARVFARLVTNKYLLEGFSDHAVSEAVYLADPDGNGVELYADRPQERWPRVGDQVRMSTEPLDVQELLSQAALDEEPWQGMDPGTDIGHVHLQVADLSRSEEFYSGVLGLEVTQRNYPGALFLAAGAYHHHVGVNVWAGKGAPRPALDTVGLLSFGLRIPDKEAWYEVMDRCKEAGLEFAARDTEQGTSALVVDPDGNGVELIYGTGVRPTEDPIQA